MTDSLIVECLPDIPPTLRVVAMPRDTNPFGDIFGGWVMALMDQAGRHRRDLSRERARRHRRG